MSAITSSTNKLREFFPSYAVSSSNAASSAASSVAKQTVQNLQDGPTPTEELLAKHVLGAKVRSASCSLDLTETAFKAASLARSLQKAVGQKEAIIAAQANQIATLEERLAEAIAENQAIRHQLQTQADQLVIQGSNNEVLTTRLAQNQMRCSQLEQELITERTRLADREKFDRLKTERKKLNEASAEHLHLLAAKTASSIGALLFLAPILVPLVSIYTLASLSTNKDLDLLAARRIVVIDEMAEIKTRNPDFQ